LGSGSMSERITFEVVERDDINYRGLKIRIHNPNLKKEYQDSTVDIAIEKCNNRVSVLIPYLAICDFDNEDPKVFGGNDSIYLFELKGLKEDREKLRKIKEGFRLLNEVEE